MFNGYLNRHENYYSLWLASPSTRFEMEQYYFSNTRFQLCSPKDLESFADHLSTYQWSLLRSVLLDVPGAWGSEYQYSLKEWMSACARLPPNLVSIIFSANTWEVMGAEIHGHWFLVTIFPDVTANLELHRASIFINTLAKLAHRVAAKATIGLSVAGAKCIERREPRYTHYRVLDDLEPWSKNFLSWWEAETKIDFNDRETFNKVG